MPGDDVARAALKQGPRSRIDSGAFSLCVAEGGDAAAPWLAGTSVAFVRCLVAPAPLDFRGSVAALRSAGHGGSAHAEKKNLAVAAVPTLAAEDARVPCTAGHPCARGRGVRIACRTAHGGGLRRRHRRDRALHLLGRLRWASAVSRPARDPADVEAARMRLARRPNSVGSAEPVPAKTTLAGSRAGRLTADAPRRRPR